MKDGQLIFSGCLEETKGNLEDFYLEQFGEEGLNE